MSEERDAPDDRAPASPEERLATLTSQMRERLRPVCAHWPDDLFDGMIAHLAAITIKYDDSLLVGYDRRTTDRMIAELHESLARSEERRLEKDRP